MVVIQRSDSLENRNKIYAQFNHNTVRVYQAFNHQIADEAIRLGTFGSCFKMDRMTWIKPSFLWMMYRSGWATKESQERILAIDIKKTGFNEILKNAVLSSFDKEVYGNFDNWRFQLENSEIRCQWDPDRDIYGNALQRRAIQLGLKGSMVRRYVNNWIVKIADITDSVIFMRNAIESKSFHGDILPVEKEYPLNE
ncbi:DUF4291 domain-containing protein [Neobacillus novalis]|uniref:DUF4291 domain-containing protein n=1 Tax=Neobacillus novalis TaxID=220687 RepID=A0AA95MIR3_9BACI|nr:DUF4291 domain-containing protein [Neobacillus novalis]WHY84547.1 DUF4291 domain-containing protein [Neobacillus novalis]